MIRVGIELEYVRNGVESQVEICRSARKLLLSVLVSLSSGNWVAVGSEISSYVPLAIGETTTISWQAGALSEF